MAYKRPYLYIFIIIYYLINLVLCNTSIESCPEKCSCLGIYADCSQNGIKKLPNNVPKWVAQLNLNDNEIVNLDKATLRELKQLTVLKLNRNKISKLSHDAFRPQEHLTTLELNRNRIETIEPLTFKSLEKLENLRLRKNRLKQLQAGAFWGLKNIDSLKLDWNSISSITKDWVYGLNHLRILSISNNLIAHIDQDVWDSCKDLIELNLATNRLQAITKGMFKHLSKLEKLVLNENSISYIEDGTFYNTPELKVLLLNNNKLSWTVEDLNGAFIGFNNLMELHLASNNIKSINREAFNYVKNIISLNLAENNITTIQNEAFNSLSNLRQLKMNTSKLICDCNLQQFATWLNGSVNLATQINVRCDYPQFLHGKMLTDIPYENFTCVDMPKPRLIDEEILLPKIKTALKGDNLTLLCKAKSSSRSNMTFVWKRDNVELRDVKITETATAPEGKYTEVTSELQLFNITHEDQGKYQCIVSNSFGTAYSQKCKISVMIFPKFTKMPTDITVKTGDTARLECAAYGEPQPQIEWQKDGGNDFPAARERRMHVMPTDDVFFIINVKTADMGVYSCMAHNPAGSIVGNASLTVHEMPFFGKPMENKEITAGEPIVLECMASGSPKPTLTWLKDGGPLKATDRHFFTAEDQLMIIVETTLSDAGTYECIMNNSLGTERGSSELRIIPSAPLSDDDMMGVIIITVVCCAVGTSIVWVVIIYQTRKRVSANSIENRNPINTNILAGTALSDVVIMDSSRVYTDSASDHSSCKDSGTGDSAKNSTLGDNFNLIPDGDERLQEKLTVDIHEEMHEQNSSCDKLLNSEEHSDENNYIRSTNHDRDENSIQNEHLINENNS